MKMFRFNFIRFPGFFIVIILFIGSCLDDRYDFNRISDEIQINPGISTPIAFGSLTLKDVLNELDEESYISEFDSKLLYILYNERLASYNTSDIIDIPNQNFSESYSGSGIVFPGTPGEVISIQKNKNAVFVFSNNEEPDSINIKNSSFHIDVSSSFKHSGTLTISSPDMLLNGIPFSLEIIIPDASGTFSQSFNIPLDGYKVIFDNSNPGTTQLPLEFNLELVNSGAGISPGDQCEILLSIKDIDFYSVFGYMGNYQVLSETGGIGIELFDTEFEGGRLFFHDPRINIEINNSYGIPLAVELSSLSTYSEIHDVTTPIVYSGTNPFEISVPVIIGNTALSEITINNDNSNIREAMETEPNKFYYSVSAVTNPSGPGTTYNFVTDSSKIDVDLNYILPLWLKSEGISLEDTVEFDLSKDLGEDEGSLENREIDDFMEFLNYLRITLEVQNGLPVETELQVYFTDENYTVLDSMFTPDKFILEPAQIDAEDKVSQKTENVQFAEFTEQRLDNIIPTRFIIISAIANTARFDENRHVKFYSDYSIDFKLKMRAGLNINSREF